MKLRTVVCGFLVVLGSHAAEAAEGLLDEAKLGVIDHGVGIGVVSREPGADVNGEILFVSPSFLAPIFAPRPHFGVEINTLGKNSYAYGGLTWRATIYDGIFADLGLGGAIHDGPDEASSFTRDHLGLGTRFLFHESAEVGYQFTRTWSFAVYLDHVSNADIGNHNPGITNIGGRLGYSF